MRRCAVVAANATPVMAATSRALTGAGSEALDEHVARSVRVCGNARFYRRTNSFFHRWGGFSGLIARCFRLGSPRSTLSIGSVVSDAYDRIVKRLIPDVGFHQNAYAELLDRIIRSGDRWLDIGAGSKVHDGYNVPSSNELAGRCAEVIGLDFEAAHLKANTALSRFIVGSAAQIPLANEHVDLVTANMVLEHLDDPVTVFREIARVLRPGGHFVFVTPNLSHPLIRTASIVLPPRIQRLLAHRLEGRPLEHIFPTFYRANTVAATTQLGVSAGLEVELIDVHRNIPFLRRPALAIWLECQLIRAMGLPSLRRFGADLLGVLRKPGTGADRSPV
jgi:SAM-dependent methyltransferase